MSEPHPAIRVEGLWKRYGPRDALAGVSFEAPAGSCTVVLGANGSGKTTLLRILATLAAPSEGKAEIDGLDVTKGDAGVRARLGVVLARHLLPRDFTLREALRYYADLYGVSDAAPRIEALARRVGLLSRLRDPMRTFSRGMGQRASIARALLHEPEVLLLDEPFTALDAAGSRMVVDVIREQTEGGGTVLLVSHDLDRAAELADSAIVLERGRTVFAGAPGSGCRRSWMNMAVEHLLGTPPMTQP